MGKVKRLFFDIETSPNVGLFWSTGNRIHLSPENILKERKIICIGYQWQDKQPQSLQWTAKQDDAPMLRRFAPILEQADEVVAHNGNGFDLKWVRTRCSVHGISLAPHIPSYDTLLKMRERFRLNSNTLAYAAQYFGLPYKTKTDFQLWKDVIAGNKVALQAMVAYCKQDVTVLVALYQKLQEYTLPNVHHGVIAGQAKHSCPQCSRTVVSYLRSYSTAAGSVKHKMKCTGCSQQFYINNKGLRDWRSWLEEKAAA